jgi:hypothetical protein
MCRLPWFYPSRLQARTKMIRQWRRGDWRYGHTQWCAQHAGWHLAPGLGER